MRSTVYVIVLTVTILSLSGTTSAQTRRLDARHKYPPVSDRQVARYTAYKVHQPVIVDGKLDEPEWQQVPRSPRFVDLISGRETIHDTRAAVMWDDQYLYVGFWVEEPLLRAKFTERDMPIYQDNDVEVFIAGADAYYEFEVNAYNTLYEGFFIWQEAYERAGYHQHPDFDRSKSQVTSQPFHGVGYRNHPRGGRWAFLEWDFPGAKTAIYLDGTLNDDSDRDRGWTVELAFPWRGMQALAMADHRSLPPQDRDVWRMNFFRFNQYPEAPPAEDSQGWAWNTHGVWDSHVPEVWPYIAFSTDQVEMAK